MMKRSWFIPVLLVFLVACTSEQKKSAEETTQPKKTDTIQDQLDAIDEQYAPAYPKDSIHDRMALFLAGLPQEDSSVFAQWETTDWWQEHARQMDELWTQAEEVRLSNLREWEAEELSNYLNDTLPLFYPFSGPDFLHAHYFFPEAKSYHMIAIEPVITFDLKAMNEAQIQEYLRSLRSSLRDVLGKSYFITTHMMEDLKEQKVKGVLPLFYVFLARTGHEILDVETARLDSSGIMVYDDASYHGLSILCMRDGTDSPVLVEYMDLNLVDHELNRKPFDTWVNGIGAKNGFVKAASYLMHYAGFSVIRDAMQRNTMTIFQDDTGIPLKYLDTDTYNIKLYGAYTRPIKNFTDQMMQKDLKALYESTPKEEIGTIPFPLGYHVVGDRIQNHQIFTRKE